MPQKYTIHPESLIAPSQLSPYLTVFFRRGVESRDAIYPASGLQFSFEQPDDHKEVFTERVTARDVRSNESGLCTVNLPKGKVPTFSIRRDLEDRVGDVLVKLHAWKGERHLGVWEVGRLNGKHVYTVVD
ncbi:hypothetical protein VP1G_08055 [Cytospora mali]|uniref:Uncharacterized protein n=1 Tax=Cytospora mali TaxID=578113 RepID=A0A194VA65_CYTMA|nr:hypothetical protein VP1G_08055 [Valsa mali var. pyri (nom. inval.)]